MENAIMFTPCFTSSKIDPGSCSYPHCDPKRTLAWPNIKDWSYFPTPQFGTPQCLTVQTDLLGYCKQATGLRQWLVSMNVISTCVHAHI